MPLRRTILKSINLKPLNLCTKQGVMCKKNVAHYPLFVCIFANYDFFSSG